MRQTSEPGWQCWEGGERWAGGGVGAEEEDDNEEDNNAKSNGGKKPLSAKFRDWRAEMRELDRQHRGLRSHKTVRSLDWAAGGVKRAASKAKKRLSVQERAPQVVDSEMAG